MRNRLTLLAAAATLAFTACGGSGSDQDEVADLLIEQAAGEDIELDEDCVRDTAAKLSDDDAAALVEAGVDGDPEISEAGDAIGEEIVNCLEISSYRDTLIDSIAESDPTIDADCMRDALGEFETIEEIEDEIFSAAFACTSDG